MLRKSISAFCFIAAIVLVATGSIWAAVPEKVLRAQEGSAPEAVNITALSIDETSETRPYNGKVPGASVTTRHITMTAKVDVVLRTASNLAPGSVIVVRYENTFHEPPLPGPQPTIVLNTGDRATAYLKRGSSSDARRLSVGRTPRSEL